MTNDDEVAGSALASLLISQALAVVAIGCGAVQKNDLAHAIDVLLLALDETTGKAAEHQSQRQSQIARARQHLELFLSRLDKSPEPKVR